MAWVAATVIGTAVVGGGASLLGSEIQAGASRDAAKASADAARYQTDVQRGIYDQARADQAPWRQTGGAALSELARLTGLGSPGGGASAGFPVPTDVRGGGLSQVSAPFLPSSGSGSPASAELLRPFGMSDFQADPGYAFRQAEGMKAIERSAAARGGALSGAALKAGERYGQGLASEEYGNAFNRYQTNQSNIFNRLAALAGVGQTANAATGQAGTNFANALTGISQNDATNQGNAILAGANARASGYQGAANAIGSIPSNYFLFNSLMKR